MRLEIEIPFSDSQALRNFLGKPSSHMASQARKSRVEVSVRRLDANQQAKLDVARKKEIDEWLAAEAIKVVSMFGIPEDRIMKMRFVYTWKSDGRAKARLVLQGFTDSRSGNAAYGRPDHQQTWPVALSGRLR